jgi:tetratricopeptide (TPR) repeat protein
VRFLGLKVDHRVIVEWVVAGQTVGFIGSLVAGWYAADRKKEVESLNTRLVAVNKQLREQARVAQAGIYAPSGGAAAAAAATSSGAAIADDSSPTAQEIITTLRTGKSLLKMRDGKAARGHFERALALTRDPACGLETPWKAERKALRGLGAATQLLGENEAALGYMKQVLDMSEREGDNTGVADAMGVIADMYTELGQLDKAAHWYDKYIGAMQA